MRDGREVGIAERMQGLSPAVPPASSPPRILAVEEWRVTVTSNHERAGLCPPTLELDVCVPLWL